MKERLVIKNFGPIESVDLDLGKMTILIGEQATGKSTVAKILAICRYFSYIVNFEIDNSKHQEFNLNNQFYKGIQSWNLESYLKENTEITYENKIYKVDVIVKSKVIQEDFFEKIYYNTYSKITSTSKDFEDLLQEIEILKREEISNSELPFQKIIFSYWSPNENFFRLNVKKVMDNPIYIPIERTLQSISFNKDLLISEAVQEELRKINRIIRGFNNEINIEPLSIKFRNDHGLSYVKKTNDRSYFQLSSGASGFQSTIPNYLTVKYYSEFEKRARTFIIEEPEINLFPKAQKKLMGFFAESMNQNNHQFLLPTHSPYILSSLNNLMYAYKVANEFNAKVEVKKIIDEKYWVNPNDVEVYFLENGNAKSLIDKKEGLINIDELDSVSEIINKEFDELLHLEIKLTENDKV